MKVDLSGIINQMMGEEKQVIEKSQSEMIRDEQELIASRMLKCIEMKDARGLSDYLASFFKVCEMEEELSEDKEDESL